MMVRERSPLSAYEFPLWMDDQLTGGDRYWIRTVNSFVVPIAACDLEKALRELVHSNSSLCRRVETDETGQPSWVAIAPADAIRVNRAFVDRDEHASERLLGILEADPPTHAPGFEVWLVVNEIDNCFALGVRIHHLHADTEGLVNLFAELDRLLESGGPTGDIHRQPLNVPVRKGEWSTTTASPRGDWRLSALALDDVGAGQARGLCQRLSGAGARQVRRFAASHGTTGTVVLLSAWMAELASELGVNDVAVGVPVTRAKRGRDICYSTETLTVFGSDISNRDPAAVISEVGGQVLDLATLENPRSLAGGTLSGKRLQSLFTVEERKPRLNFEGRNSASVILEGGRSICTYHLRVERRGPEMIITLTCDSQRVSESRQAAILNRYLARIDRLTVGGQEALGTYLDRSPLPWVESLLSMSREVPEHAALVMNDRTQSYAELFSRATTVYRRLRARGFGVGDRVASILEPSFDQVAVEIGVLLLGAAYMPLAPSYPRERIRTMIDIGQPSIIVTPAADFLQVPAKQLAVGELLDEADDGLGQAVPPPTPARDTAAYIVFTSGSTGSPNAVLVSHGVLDELISWQVRRSSQDSGSLTTLAFAPASFDVSFQEILCTLTAGATLVMIDAEERRDPYRILDILIRNSVRRLFLPYVALNSIAEAALDSGQWPTDLSEVITAGEQLRVTPAIRLFFEHSGASLDNQYGPSETHVVSANRLRGASSDWVDLPSIGRPLPEARLHLVVGESADDPKLRLAKAGELGEIWIGGAHLALGYFENEKLTRERFVTVGGGRFYRTGDFGCLNEDGDVQFMGRRDDQVKIRGYRVELGEVESALGQCEGVRESAAVIVEVHGENRILAFVACDDGTGIRQIRGELRSRLPDYLVPSAIRIVSDIPETPSGKIDRTALLSQVDLASEEVDPNHSGPLRSGLVSPSEIMVSRAFCEVLKPAIVATALPRDVSFFDLGGDSFSAVRLVGLLRRDLDPLFRFADLVASPSVGELSQFVDGGRGALVTRAPLIRMRDNEGASSRLVLFHQVSGTVGRYLPLVSKLPGRWSIWGVQAPGVEVGEETCASVDELAEKYAEWVRELGSELVVHLAGFSMGGVLAIEVARRLPNDPRRRVVLLDSSPPGNADESIRFALQSLVHVVLGATDTDIDAILDMSPAQRVEIVTSIATAHGMPNDELTRERVARLLLMYQVNARALASHAMAPFFGPVCLIRATEEDGSGELPDAWSGLLPNLHTTDVRSNHISLLDEPAVTDVADVLEAACNGEKPT